MKPELPIDSLSASEFNKFKKTYLDRDRLDEDVMREIEKLFSVGDKNVARVRCDEAHAHGYECLEYESPVAGIVGRLVKEIREYREMLAEINEMSSLENL